MLLKFLSFSFAVCAIKCLGCCSIQFEKACIYNFFVIIQIVYFLIQLGRNNISEATATLMLNMIGKLDDLSLELLDLSVCNVRILLKKKLNKVKPAGFGIQGKRI